MIIRFNQQAGAYEVYRPDAFAGVVGTTTTLEGIPATLVSAEVARDGRSVELEFEVDGIPPALRRNPR